jgi:hypothetical protein
LGSESVTGIFRTSVKKEDNIKMNDWKLGVKLVWPAVRTAWW